MTSQGTAHGRFSRAIQQRQLLSAELAARELGRLSLEDALALTLLIQEQEPSRFDRAGVRWLERFIAERRPTLEQVALAASALAQIRVSANGAGVVTLQHLIGSAKQTTAWPAAGSEGASSP
jgi:hypothetical protein